VPRYGGRVQLTHRCFALAPDPMAISRIFGSPEAGKAEILSHWAAAARHPDGERIAVEAMRAQPFPYPYSMPGLKACKAAERLGGPDAHWDLFDRIQHAHAVEARNIGDPEVLASLARDVGLDLPRWRELFASQEIEHAVRRDLEEAARQGIHAVPTVVLPDGTRITGAVSEAAYARALDRALAHALAGEPQRPV
jgi:putative protein-disulfide isomerase